jgi:hypothetical protein
VGREGLVVGRERLGDEAVEGGRDGGERRVEDLVLQVARWLVSRVPGYI